MKRQRFISCILLAAFALLFSHTIIPHHHHDEERMEQHNNSHDDDDDDCDHDFLGQAFSHFQHHGGAVVVSENITTSFKGSNASLAKDCLPFFQYVIRLLYDPPLKHFVYPSISSYASSPIVTSLFRGPPTMTMA